MKIRVVIDTREEDLWAELAAHTTMGEEGWWVEKATLDVGDIAFYAATASDTTTTLDLSGATTSGGTASEIPLAVLERKTAEDLGASQKDGRYREQRARLFARRGAKTAIADRVEAPPWSPSLSRTWCKGKFNEVQLQQAIVRINLRYTIPVFMSAGLKETKQWIRRIAKSLVADPAVFQEGVASTTCAAAAAYTEAIHVKKADNATPERIFLSFLLAIPGMGKAAASALAEATHSKFSELQTMTQEQLCEVKVGKRKLSKTLAANLYTALHA
jgi:ERCC4-type nuclease